MRKLREAALVATMVGSASVLGVGVASAHGAEDNGPAPRVICNQDAGGDTETTQVGLINIGSLGIGGSGDALSDTTQQVCGIGNGNNTNTGGDSESGAGGDGTIGLAL
ncbi:hypothetical protein K378_04192 [Streptomyces sp. Amel2xB2]|uniref:hypothetical protein n=1 Tax=Streptomyces sp. Amel2xB2 TaxID=1305829 RepID=UPI000DBF7F9E|nr:hypothetical protein [Streptomyces sp. Amel2xB2]RAJ61828.1 hypothetical protein K378_04192 [Streptomyces sp. Amel2xB2]